jgi:adenylosuccinate synthase
MTRHGPGPFVTEDSGLDLPEPHNGCNQWQGEFRLGHFDAVALRYAIEVCGGVDAIALTHLDTAARQPGLRICRSYQAQGQALTRLAPGPAQDLDYQEQLTRLLQAAKPVYEQAGGDWASSVEQETGAPVMLRSYGPTAAGKSGRSQRSLRRLAA